MMDDGLWMMVPLATVPQIFLSALNVDFDP